ncbi:hypothetical protein QE152_g7079 [Popillia japonica]|uniref:Uncharacterized protein n=1 Tax=Popillia japonica TaxID=7064 RepID=A0AAW1MF45_POPJA
MGSSPNKGHTLPDVAEDDDDASSVSSDHNHFQLQILVTPCHGPDGGTEIKVSGGIGNPRSGSRKLPPIHNAQGSRRTSRQNSGNVEVATCSRSRLQTLSGDPLHGDSISFVRHKITPARKQKYINSK